MNFGRKSNLYQQVTDYVVHVVRLLDWQPAARTDLVHLAKESFKRGEVQ